MVSKSKINLELEIPVGTYYGDKPTKVYCGYSSYGNDLVKNFIFKDTLTYTGFSKGRSSVKFNFVGSDGSEYEMFTKDFSELVKVESVNKITGEWSFVKRGANYGLVKVID